MNIEYQHPVEDEFGTLTHPAFGCITITRPTGGIGRLYGSDFKHQHFIRLAIGTSKMERKYGKSYHYGSTKELIEVYLSEAQWASIVSSVGNGGGTPCTLQYFNGQQIPQIAEPETTPSDLFKEDVLKVFKDMLTTLDEIKEVVDNTKLSQKAKNSLISMVERVIMNLKSNLPFVHRTVGEYMEDTVAKGKAEIEAYGKELLLRLGKESADYPIMLDEKKDI